MAVALSTAFKEGIYPAVATPIVEDTLECDVVELRRHCLDLLAGGSAGLVLFGTTGEGPSFPAAEKLSVYKALVEQEGLRSELLLLGSGSSSLIETVELLKGGLALGCPGFLVCPPSFYSVSEEGVIAYYRELIARVGPTDRLKIILYHIPQFSGVHITLNCAKTLRNEFPSIVVGIKESEGNMPLIKALIDGIPGFQVWPGSERMIVEAVRYGAAGSICGIANMDPQLHVQLFQLGKSQEDPTDALQKLEKVFSALTIEGVTFIPALKAFLAHKYSVASWKFVRPPLLPLAPEPARLFISALSS